MTIKQNGGIFGRNPSFKSIELDGTDLETTLDAKADLAGDTFTGQVNINTSGTGGLSVTAAGNGEIVASRTSGASVKIQSQSARGLIGTTSNHSFRLIANGQQYVDLSTSGNLEVMSGNLKIGTSGKGIDFSATSGTGTSELFDDYEEGTFTPAFAGSSTAGSFTYTTQNGVYTKIGNIVIASSHVKVASVTTPAAGFLRLTGGPFTSNGSTVSSSAITATIAFTNSYVSAKMRSSGSTEVIFYDVGTGGITTVDASLIVANSEIQVTAIYYTG